MSELTSWQASAMPAAEREAHFAAVRSYEANLSRIGRAYRRSGTLFGMMGLVVGLSGMIAAASLFPLKQTTIRFIEVDRSTGYVGEPVSVIDAPRLFGETVMQHAMRDLVEACEGYNFATMDLTFHRCAIMLAPQVQVQYLDRVGPKNPLAPRVADGKAGWVRVEPVMSFQAMQASQGGTFGYVVRWLRSESPSGSTAKTSHWSTTIYFQFHPEYLTNPQDRSMNPTGFTAVSYSSDQDPT
jgi:type IV secretion system protein VirB8